MCRELQQNQPQYGVKEQSDYAGKLQQLLSWLKPEPTYDITFSDDDEIFDKGDLNGLHG